MIRVVRFIGRFSNFVISLYDISSLVRLDGSPFNEDISFARMQSVLRFIGSPSNVSILLYEISRVSRSDGRFPKEDN
jgi:hypothetical protein